MLTVVTGMIILQCLLRTLASKFTRVRVDSPLCKPTSSLLPQGRGCTLCRSTSQCWIQTSGELQLQRTKIKEDITCLSSVVIFHFLHLPNKTTSSVMQLITYKASSEKQFPRAAHTQDHNSNYFDQCFVPTLLKALTSIQQMLNSIFRGLSFHHILQFSKNCLSVTTHTVKVDLFYLRPLHAWSCMCIQ